MQYQMINLTTQLIRQSKQMKFYKWNTYSIITLVPLKSLLLYAAMPCIA